MNHYVVHLKHNIIHQLYLNKKIFQVLLYISSYGTNKFNMTKWNSFPQEFNNFTNQFIVEVVSLGTD